VPRFSLKMLLVTVLGCGVVAAELRMLANAIGVQTVGTLLYIVAVLAILVTPLVARFPRVLHSEWTEGQALPVLISVWLIFVVIILALI